LFVSIISETVHQKTYLLLPLETYMTKSIEEIRKVKKDIEPELLKKSEVTGAAIGKKIVAGQEQDELCITVFVNKKKNEDEIPATELIPKEKNGVKIDVVERKPYFVPDSQANRGIQRHG
jgi:hypothetical protein